MLEDLWKISGGWARRRCWRTVGREVVVQNEQLCRHIVANEQIELLVKFASR